MEMAGCQQISVVLKQGHASGSWQRQELSIYCSFRGHLQDIAAALSGIPLLKSLHLDSL